MVLSFSILIPGLVLIATNDERTFLFGYENGHFVLLTRDAVSPVGSSSIDQLCHCSDCNRQCSHVVEPSSSAFDIPFQRSGVSSSAVSAEFPSAPMAVHSASMAVSFLPGSISGSQLVGTDVQPKKKRSRRRRSKEEINASSSSAAVHSDGITSSLAPANRIAFSLPLVDFSDGVDLLDMEISSNRSAPIIEEPAIQSRVEGPPTNGDLRALRDAAIANRAEILDALLAQAEEEDEREEREERERNPEVVKAEEAERAEKERKKRVRAEIKAKKVAEIGALPPR